MVPESVAGFAYLLVSLACLGTWPALLRLCSIGPVSSPSSSRSDSGNSCGCWIRRWSADRDARFAYLDYALSYVVSSSIPLLMETKRANAGGNNSGKGAEGVLLLDCSPRWAEVF